MMKRRRKRHQNKIERNILIGRQWNVWTNWSPISLINHSVQKLKNQWIAYGGKYKESTQQGKYATLQSRRFFYINKINNMI